MKYPIVTAPFLKVNAMAIFPFILVREPWMKDDAVLIRHERIHLRQEIELLILPFYIFYLLNYLVNIYRFSDHHKAYLQIIFEQEAYAGEENSAYLDYRPYYAWRKFMKIH